MRGPWNGQSSFRQLLEEISDLQETIVKNFQSVTIDVGIYQAKRDFLYKGLTDMEYSVVKPQGAFYMFPKAPIADDLKFVNALREYNVLVVPGRGFGLALNINVGVVGSGEDHIRMYVR